MHTEKNMLPKKLAGENIELISISLQYHFSLITGLLKDRHILISPQ
jgi:hypothetical protein